MQFVCVFLCAAAAWFAAGLFSAEAPKESSVSAGVAGLCCTLLAYCLSLLSVSLDISPLLFPLLAFALPLQRQRRWELRVTALLTALGAYGLLTLHCRRSLALLSPVLGAILGLTAPLVFAGIVFLLRNQFPPEDWPEFFHTRGEEPSQVQIWHIWLVLGLTAIAELALCYVFPAPNTYLQAAALIATGAILWSGSLYAVCLAVSCRRERLTTLVDQDYRNEMQAYMSVIRSQRHDYNFHVQAMAGLIRDGDLEACRKYVDSLTADSAAMNTIMPVKDPAIAALIFSFRTMAQEYDIQLYLDIQNDLSAVVTSVYETNKVIGNLLQNAIDEVRTHEDRSFGIHLYILKRGENCIIHAANKIKLPDNPEAYLQGMYQPGWSTKQGHEGIGLVSIQNLLRRYRGVVYSRIDGDVIHCIAKIPLSMEKGEEA